jgi:hypothetical protein
VNGIGGSGSDASTGSTGASGPTGATGPVGSGIGPGASDDGSGAPTAVVAGA